MNFEQAQKYAFLVKWKVAECFSGPECWCRIIIPMASIYYSHPENPDNIHEYSIVDAGALDQQTAEYIVRLHNESLEQNQSIADSMQSILKQPQLNGDCGISQ